MSTAKISMTAARRSGMWRVMIMYADSMVMSMSRMVLVRVVMGLMRMKLTCVRHLKLAMMRFLFRGNGFLFRVMRWTWLQIGQSDVERVNVLRRRDSRRDDCGVRFRKIRIDRVH